MDEVMNSVSVQIQRAINDEISNQVLAQIRNAIMAGSGHMTRRGWDVPTERRETNSEVLRNVGTRDNSRSEHVQNRQNDDQTYHTAYDSSISLIENILSWNFINRRLTSAGNNRSQKFINRRVL